MDPNTMLMVGVIVLAVAQLLAAVQVMRSASDRPDLTGLARFVPVLLTLFIPIFGPFIAGRATGAGVRPMLISVVGTVIFALTYILGPGAGAQAPRVAQAPQGQPAQPTPGQPADNPAAAPAGGQPAPPAVTGGTATETPQPPAASAPAAQPETGQPTAQPAPEQPAEAAPIPAEQPPVASAEVKVIPVPALPGGATTVAVRGAPGQPAERVPVSYLLTRRVQSAGQVLITPQQSGGVLEDYLGIPSAYNNTRMTFAAAYTSPPRTRIDPQLYLGGKVWYFNTLSDWFPPHPLADAELYEGQTVLMASARGNYLAEVKFTSVETGPEDRLVSATLDVNVR